MKKSPESSREDWHAVKAEMDELRDLAAREAARIKELEFLLQERMKELDCHQKISSLMAAHHLAKEEVFQRIVEALPAAFQFPEEARARLRIGSDVYETPGFFQSGSFLLEEIRTEGRVLGDLLVCYSGKNNIASEAHFLNEEHVLLTTIAEQIGNYVERKVQETDLHNQEEKYRKLVENVHEVIYEINSEGTIVYVSPSVTHITGYTPEDLTGKNFLVFFGENRELLRERWQQVELKNHVSNEYRFITKSGEPIWLRLSTSARFIDGKFDGGTGTLTDVTQRKKMETELFESEALYRSILDASPDAITITDLEGNVLMSSARAAEMFGAPNSAVFINRNLFEFIHPSHHEKARKGIEDMFHGIFDGDSEYLGVRLDGTTFNSDSKGEFIRDSEGNPVRMVFITRDITWKKEAEKTLERTRERYQRLVENINDAIYEVDTKGTVLYVSPSIQKIVGYDPADLIGQNFFSFLHPDDRPILYQALAKLGAEDYSHLEYRYFHKDGSLRWVRSSTKPIIEDGIKVGGIGSLTDITERKKNEEELIKLSRAVEQSPASIVITNLDGNIEYANPKACETTGYSLDELVGKNPRVLKSGDTSDEDYTKLWNTISTGSQWKGIFHNKRKNGELYWESSSISPIIDASGTITHYLAVKEDITERIKAQKALTQSEATLKYQNEKLNAIIEAIPDAIMLMDDQGTFLEVFSPDNHLNRMTREQILGRKVHEVFTPELGAIYMEQSAKCLKGKQLVTFNMTNIQEGQSVFNEIRLVPIGDHKVLTFIRDFTEQKQKDEQIRKLSLAVEQSPISIVITDLEGNIEYVNPSFAAATGYNFEEVLGENTNILKSGQTSRQTYDEMWSRIQSGHEWSGEWINRKKNGELYWESVTICPIHDDDGKITNYLALKQDISERKQTEQEIRELNATLEQRIEERTAQLTVMNENLLQQIEERRQIEEALQKTTEELENFFSVALDLLCIADTSGRFIRVNKAWGDILGYSTSQLEGVSYLDFVHPDDMQSTLDAMSQLSEQKPIMDFINRYRASDGTYRFIEWHSYPVGQMIYAAARDITERKQAEEFEREMLDMSPQLTGLPYREIDNALNLALSRIGRFLDADRTYIFEIDFKSGTMKNTHEWCNEGIEPQIDNLQEIPTEALPHWMDSLNRHETILVPSVKNLPAEWTTEREILESQDIQSLLVIPILIENSLIGFVGLDSVKREKQYTAADINILKVWSSMLASLINNLRSETILEQTRENYITFYNTIDEMLLVVDSGGLIIETNQTLRTRLGYSDKELAGESVLMVHPAERKEEASQILQGLSGGGVGLYTIPLQSKSGELIQVETRLKAGLWNGHPAIFVISKDISEIKLSEQKFSAAFRLNSAMMAISRVDTGEYLDVNNAFLETLGFTREEIIGSTNQKLGLFVDPQLRQSIVDELNRNIRVEKETIKMRTKEGNVKTGYLSADLINVGQDRCMLSVTIDITDRVRAEEALSQARIEAEQANLAKSEFLSRMSHELRTPMNSILGFAQLLEMGGLSDIQSRGVGHILKSGKHLLDLINEVLDMSRIESGRLSLSLEPVQVRPLIAEMLETIRPQATARSIETSLVGSPEAELFIKTDQQRIKQVLLNLLSNSVKYNKQGGSIRILIEPAPKSANGQPSLRISVTDTGIGIAETDFPKLFTPFERIGAEKTETEGTGLGLSVVKKLTEAMGGIIGVVSKFGEGSTFWLEIPLAEGQIEFIDKAGILKADEISPQEVSGTILYIEDNLSNVDLVSQLLAIHRPQIKLETDIFGLNAVPLATRYQPDLILLDLNLPDIHGSEVIKLLKADSATRNIPVVVITADAMPHQYQKLMKEGARKYLTKPLDVAELLITIDDIIKP